MTKYSQKLGRFAYVMAGVVLTVGVLWTGAMWGRTEAVSGVRVVNVCGLSTNADGVSGNSPCEVASPATCTSNGSNATCRDVNIGGFDTFVDVAVCDLKGASEGDQFKCDGSNGGRTITTINGGGSASTAEFIGNHCKVQLDVFKDDGSGRQLINFAVVRNPDNCVDQPTEVPQTPWCALTGPANVNVGQLFDVSWTNSGNLQLNTGLVSVGWSPEIVTPNPKGGLPGCTSASPECKFANLKFTSAGTSTVTLRATSTTGQQAICNLTVTAMDAPTLTPTLTITPTVNPTVTLTPTITPTITLTSTVTPTGTISPTPTFTITPTSTVTSTPTPTATPASATPNQCGGTCGSNSNCQGDQLFCFKPDPINRPNDGYCRSINCPLDNDCYCPGGTATTPAPVVGSTPKTGAESWLGGLVMMGLVGAGLRMYGLAKKYWA